MTNMRRRIYHNGMIIDGRGGAYIGYLAIEGAHIVAVGRGEAPRKIATDGAQTTDLAGRTILPGLIDCHVHLAMNADAAPKPLVTAVDHKVALFRAAGTPCEPCITGSRLCAIAVHPMASTSRSGVPGRRGCASRRACC